MGGIASKAPCENSGPVFVPSLNCFCYRVPASSTNNMDQNYNFSPRLTGSPFNNSNVDYSISSEALSDSDYIAESDTSNNEIDFDSDFSEMCHTPESYSGSSQTLVDAFADFSIQCVDAYNKIKKTKNTIKSMFDTHKSNITKSNSASEEKKQNDIITEKNFDGIFLTNYSSPTKKWNNVDAMQKIRDTSQEILGRDKSPLPGSRWYQQFALKDKVKEQKQKELVAKSHNYSRYRNKLPKAIFMDNPKAADRKLGALAFQTGIHKRVRERSGKSTLTSTRLPNKKLTCSDYQNPFSDLYYKYRDISHDHVRQNKSNNHNGRQSESSRLQRKKKRKKDVFKDQISLSKYSQAKSRKEERKEDCLFPPIVRDEVIVKLSDKNKRSTQSIPSLPNIHKNNRITTKLNDSSEDEQKTTTSPRIKR